MDTYTHVQQMNKPSQKKTLILRLRTTNDFIGKYGSPIVEKRVVKCAS